MPGIEVLRIKDYYYDNNLSGATVSIYNDRRFNNFRKTYQAEDGYEYVITGNEEMTVPGEVGAAWRAVDPDLELVSRS